MLLVSIKRIYAERLLSKAMYVVLAPSIANESRRRESHPCVLTKGKTHPSCTTEKMNREEEEEEVCGAYASRCFQASREEETIQPGHKLFRRTSR